MPHLRRDVRTSPPDERSEPACRVLVRARRFDALVVDVRQRRRQREHAYGRAVAAGHRWVRVGMWVSSLIGFERRQLCRDVGSGPGLVTRDHVVGVEDGRGAEHTA